MGSNVEFAILAPVPLEHLKSGRELAATQPFVAYGTNKWDLMAKIDERAQGERVPMLLYPSHEGVEADPSCIVSWFGWYVGHKFANNAGRYPDASKRPVSTKTDGPFAAFWHIEGLRELPKDKQTPIGKIQGFKGGWRKDAPPRGPELVLLPEIFEDEE